MDELILVKYGEIILKGLNRPLFEEKLIKNIKNVIKDLGKIKVTKAQATIYVEPLNDDVSITKVIERLKKVSGIVSISRVAKMEKDLDEINNKCVEYLRPVLDQIKTFKVETKRADKKFPLKSPEISREVGGYILSQFNHLVVDVHNPDIVVNVEVRDTFAYVYTEKIAGIGGMPIGTNGKAALLLSGGIDSPVAGWMIAKRGVELEAVHFFSAPYTSERAKDKVIELAKIMASYCGRIKLHIVPFTDIQLDIHEKCPEDQMTLIMRRFMMKIAERIAVKSGCNALITGESLGQVASQTIQSLGVTNAAVDLPVFRPLIGMDKDEIVTIARKIDTFETSILPYEDCCTVFVPKHPKTKPVLDKIVESETHLDVETMVDKAVNDTEVIEITAEK
ncbi:tRNA uracil 4-sulfurtransferase ThiI [Petroclostridium sp. X23]|uniref:tRNA uracil 4-sulfurtransferase ThiI n=1 Tax=Petroclostridium sp. X23 TaxID=3045146 RepID=UPI0024AD4FB3|nr:tRNA uracil 4-sulfurtransferase ThiI [Petroclostridium sp. X23]WHH59397.1 tRNA uracil 4-sulfurtransferase ThiI [Petroclostridium sp. X23]